MCAGIGQYVVLSIPNGWCGVGGDWNDRVRMFLWRKAEVVFALCAVLLM